MKISNSVNVNYIKNLAKNEKKDNVNENYKNENSDSVSISDEAKKLFDGEQLDDAYLEDLKRQFEASKNDDNKFDDIWKYMKIVMRIINGDHVPQSDVRKLIEACPKLYQMAELMKKQNHKPKDYDRIFEEEKKNDSDTEIAVSETSDIEMNDSESTEAVSEVLAE